MKLIRLYKGEINYYNNSLLVTVILIIFFGEVFRYFFMNQISELLKFNCIFINCNDFQGNLNFLHQFQTP